MMPETDNPWFRLGHAFERTLQTLSSPGATLSTLRHRQEGEDAAGAEAGPGAGARASAGGRAGAGASAAGRDRGSRRRGADDSAGGNARGGRDFDADEETDDGNPISRGGAAERVKQALEHLPFEEDELSRIVDALFAAGAGTVVNRLLERWGRGGPHSAGALVKAGTAGAAAALVMEALRPLLERNGRKLELDAELGYAVMEGAGRGLIYGLLLHRRIPGPSAMKGAVYGTAEYLVGPWGGVSHLLHPLTPQSSLPVVGALLDPGDRSEDTLVEHLVFGTSLALLYGLGDD
ncbi:MAG: hypothetical protein WDZ89_05035 [Gemmatimonadota bacterium]